MFSGPILTLKVGSESKIYLRIIFKMKVTVEYHLLVHFDFQGDIVVYVAEI